MRRDVIHGVLVALGLILYSFLRIGAGQTAASLPVAMMLSVLIFVLGVLLYYGIAVTTYNRGLMFVTAGFAIGMTMLFLFPSPGSLLLVALPLAGLTLAGVTTGELIRRGQSQLTAYLVGGVITALLLMASLAPIWSELTLKVIGLKETTMADFRSSAALAGQSPERVTEYLEGMSKLFDILIRLMPALLVLGAVVSYSLGTLGFFQWVSRRQGQSTPLQTFLYWRVPFAVLPLVIVAVSLRLIGVEPFTRVADNLILVLAVFYGIAGLALMEYFLRRLGFTPILRLFMYVMLLIAQVAGFVVIAMLGLIDSHFDWRRSYEQKISLENE